jgi:hypothetical protein
MEAEIAVKPALIMPNTAFSFRKGQLAKVTESLAEYLKESNISPLKFGSKQYSKCVITITLQI